MLSWPEQVVACRVSLSRVSSVCAKLLLMECGYLDYKKLLENHRQNNHTVI